MRQDDRQGVVVPPVVVVLPPVEAPVPVCTALWVSVCVVVVAGAPVTTTDLVPPDGGAGLLFTTTGGPPGDSTSVLLSHPTTSKPIAAAATATAPAAILSLRILPSLGRVPASPCPTHGPDAGRSVDPSMRKFLTTRRGFPNDRYEARGPWYLVPRAC